MDPIRPISGPIGSIPPVQPVQRLSRITPRRHDPRGRGDGDGQEERAPDGDQGPPDEEHPHIDVSA